MRIMIKAGKFQYDLDLDNRITIIQGNSGTGKTTLANLIDEMNFAPKSYVKVYPKVQIRRFIKSDLESKNYDKNIIFIIDEGTFERSKEFAKIVNNVENKFIIITRDSLPTIHYSSDSVNTLEMDSNNVYKLKKRFKDLNNNCNINKLDKVVTEDSKSGYKFMKNLENLKVTSAKSNSKIQKYISKNDNLILFYDNDGIGPYIEEIVKLSLNKNVFHINPLSFEWLLVKSGIFNNKLVEKLEKEINIINKEKKYFEILKEITKTEAYCNTYSKKNIDEVFLKDNNFKLIINKIDENFSINLLELNKENETSWGL